MERKHMRQVPAVVRWGALVLVTGVAGVLLFVPKADPAVSAELLSGPCQTLISDLQSSGAEPSDVAGSFGLPAVVLVPSSLEVGKMLCWGTRQEGQEPAYVIHAIAVDDASGTRAWHVQSIHPLDDFEARDWREALADSGFPGVIPTEYGFATEPDAGPSTANLWAKIKDMESPRAD